VSLPELQRVGVKIFCEDGARVDLLEFIPIFHRWIQAGVLDRLIDVADYSHVPDGPGIILVAQRSIYGIDESAGRRGLVYYLRRPEEGPLAVHLAAAVRSALTAARMLTAEPELAGRLAFRGSALRLFANDRLAAPNTDETLAAFRPALTPLLAVLYPGSACTLAREPDPRERFAVTVEAPAPVAVEMLLERLGR
jgi:hypothetical protein